MYHHTFILRFIGAVIIASSFAACSGSSSTNSPLPTAVQSLATYPANTMQSCETPLPGDDMRCFAEFRTDLYASDRDLVQSAAPPPGYGPAQIQSAYRLPSSTAGTGQTVAVVDAYDDPNAARDLAVYRARFGLPVCSTGCFRKVSQNGTLPLPASNAGWAQEISLDLDMVSATCPKCHILLVEAQNAYSSNLALAASEAVHLGATVVSNSYGGAEFSATNASYTHSGVIFTASSGDNGTGPVQPCTYATVVCVGATTLERASNTRGWTETAWSRTGSGCSTFVAKPSWQTDKGCRHRSESDVSVVGDPNTGVAVYDSVSFNGFSGWLVFGGTSASSPIVASIYALAGNARTLDGAQRLWEDLDTSSINDVTSGSNGSCSITYICHAGDDYDGPSGVGTPNGIAAF